MSKKLVIPDPFMQVLYDIKKRQIKNIIVLTGAGISVSAGIPDFRSKGTGVYDNLAKYNLPKKEDIFSLDYFIDNPASFFDYAANHMLNTNYEPTMAHNFIKILNDMGVLLRNYSQNVDALELKAGLPEHKLIQVHGGFNKSAQCTNCNIQYNPIWLNHHLKQTHGNIVPKCIGCKNGIIKPGITFFGEYTPIEFERQVYKDLAITDCVIVMGTSLTVNTFTSLMAKIPPAVPRLLINRELVGEWTNPMYKFYTYPLGCRSALLCNCDDACEAILEILDTKNNF
jgi:NAD+-dependent protein deacetylase sirtuin 2